MRKKATKIYSLSLNINLPFFIIKLPIHSERFRRECRGIPRSVIKRILLPFWFFCEILASVYYITGLTRFYLSAVLSGRALYIGLYVINNTLSDPCFIACTKNVRYFHVLIFYWLLVYRRKTVRLLIASLFNRSMSIPVVLLFSLLHALRIRLSYIQLLITRVFRCWIIVLPLHNNDGYEFTIRWLCKNF
jgi:hypothetical protein